jgi:hypothetical protein
MLEDQEYKRFGNVQSFPHQCVRVKRIAACPTFAAPPCFGSPLREYGSSDMQKGATRVARPVKAGAYCLMTGLYTAFTKRLKGSSVVPTVSEPPWSAVLCLWGWRHSSWVMSSQRGPRVLGSLDIHWRFSSYCDVTGASSSDEMLLPRWWFLLPQLRGCSALQPQHCGSNDAFFNTRLHICFQHDGTPLHCSPEVRTLLGTEMVADMKLQFPGLHAHLTSIFSNCFSGVFKSQGLFQSRWYQRWTVASNSTTWKWNTEHTQNLGTAAGPVLTQSWVVCPWTWMPFRASRVLRQGRVIH